MKQVIQLNLTIEEANRIAGCLSLANALVRAIREDTGQGTWQTLEKMVGDKFLMASMGLMMNKNNSMEVVAGGLENFLREYYVANKEIERLRLMILKTILEMR